MKLKIRNIFCLPLLFVSIICFEARAQEDAIQRYAWQYHTVGHKLLQIEESYLDTAGNLASEFDRSYRFLDSILHLAEKRIKFSPSRGGNRGRATLKKIDKLLFDLGFIMFHSVNHLHDGIRPRQLAEEEFRIFTINMPPAYRKKFRKHSKPSYFFADCDVGSVIYLSIGEVIGLPVYGVNVPGHMFVRWKMKSGETLNWETQWGKTRSNNFYRKRHRTTPEMEAFHQYMQELSNEELEGFYYFLWGVRLLGGSRHVEGIEFLEKAHSKNPATPNVKMWLADAYAQSEDPENHQKAESICLELLSTTQKNVHLLNIHGNVKNKLGKHHEAVHSLDQAISLDPMNGFGYIQRGLAHLRQGSLGEAIADLSRSVEINDSNADAYLHLGLAYQMQGNNKDACVNLKQAFELAGPSILNQETAEFLHACEDK